MRKNEIWVIAGASGGMGSALVEKLLSRGFCVAALTRTPERVLERHGPRDTLLALEADICDEESVRRAHAEVLKRFGRYDVVVNATGYGLRGAIEEVSDAEARAAFRVNLFGMLNVCRNFVPDLRERGSGCVINFASIGAVAATPCNAVTNATQFAVDALTDALNKEMGQFGLAAICVKSGPIRTDYPAHRRQAEKTLEAYDQVRAAADAEDAALRGRESGDPEKVAELLIRLSAEDAPPKNLYLTRTGVETARSKWKFLEKEFEEWKWATLAVDFPREECYYGKRS